MAPSTKASREMAVASRSIDTTRKRFASDSEPDDDDSDNDSGSDFCTPQTVKKRSNAKKPRTSASNSTKATMSSLTVTTPPIKLPKEMACPEGVTPFSKAHWNAMGKTDEFWTYLDRVLSGHLKKRIVVKVETTLNADQQDKKDAKEAKESAKINVRPSAIKSGPVQLGFDTRGPPSNSSEIETNKDEKPSILVQSSVKAPSSILTPERSRELLAEQHAVLAAVKAAKMADDLKAKEDNSVKENAEIKDAGDEQKNDAGLNGGSSAAGIDKDGDDQNTTLSSNMDKSESTNNDGEKRRWSPKGW